jgi:hypothetical protein
VAQGFSPLDEELALWPGDFAPSLVESAVRLATWVPFPHLPQLLQGFSGTLVSEPTIRRATERAGAAAEAVQTAAVERLERELPAPPAGPTVQQVSVDGAMVPLRGKGEWAEVKTLAIGTVQPPVPNAKGELEVHATELSYFSRMTDADTFTRLATVETHRRGTETARTVCGVVDGAPWCQGFLDVQRPDAVRILDFPHPAGYLTSIAHIAFGEGTPEADAWRETQRHALRHETPEAVLAACRTVRDLVASRPGATAVGGPLELLDQHLAYLEKRVDQMRYASFVAQGYPIGSGIVESANKLVVEARLKGAGMHWAPEHVNPMVALRTIACSDRWEEAWPVVVPQVRAQQRATAAQRRATRRAALLTPGPASSPVVGSAVVPVADAPLGDPVAGAAGATTNPVAPVAARSAGTRSSTPAGRSPPSAAPGAPTPRRPAAHHPWRRYPAVLPKPAAAAA